MEGFAELKEAVEKVKLVDAHAHNIVSLHSKFPFLSCFSEATGDALSSALHTINFKRSIREISELYGSNISLHAIQEYRSSHKLEESTALCFKAAGISVLLIDDGLDLDMKNEVEWHKNFVPVVGRILRIEHLVEKILDEGKSEKKTWTLDSFMEVFMGRLKSYPDKVVAFKSIAAYRSGLEFNTEVTAKEAEEGLKAVLNAGSPALITNKNFIDYIFIHALEVAQSFDLPIQIHTGFGDKDLDLRLSNPLHLRNLLEDKRFSKCRIVLLHASYPFSKEASYLASVYPQVYLDFGLAVPKLSFHGMVSSIKELLELAPMNKVMFSTDGVAFPEAFYLGAKKAREVVFTVLRDACMDGDLSIAEAIAAVRDIFSENAKQFYKINIAVEALNSKTDQSPSHTKVDSNSEIQDVTLVRILWIDASGQHRCRAVTQKRFNDYIQKNGVGLTCASMGMSSFSDGPADGSNLSAVGEIRLIPDLSTKCKLPWAKQQEMVLSDMCIAPGEAWEYCPREALRRVSRVLKDEFDLVMNAGFENEFFLLKSVVREGKQEWLPFDYTMYCSTASFDAASSVLEEIVASLQSLNITVEQLHAESGNGQFEFALGYTECASAADTLIFAREVIRAVARKHGLLATFVPKYALDDIGSGSHVHLSLSKNGENVFIDHGGSARHGMSKVGEAFMAGVLEHLPSIMAFTAPVPNSYDRIQPNTWSGAYQCWGRQNREAPLRTASSPGVPNGFTNFEVKVFDGCANPYLGLASIIAAGIDGLRRRLTLPEPVDENPENLKASIRRLPKSLAESVEALERNETFKGLINEKLLVAIQAVRKAEIKYYSENNNAYKELIHKY
nr:protein fluG [Ipomoea batatas]